MNFSKRKEFALTGSKLFPLRAVHIGIDHFYHIRCPPLNDTIFITHVRNCVKGATPMFVVIYVSPYVYKEFETKL